MYLRLIGRDENGTRKDMQPFAPVVVLSLLPRCYEHTHTQTHCFFLTHHFDSSHFYTPLTAHHIHCSVSLIIFSDVYCFISLSPYQHSYLLVCHSLSVSSIYPSFHSLSPFFPHFLSCSICVFLPSHLSFINTSQPSHAGPPQHQ